MQKVAIVTDSTTDIPAALAEELNILVAPIRIAVKGREYRDKIDISREEFYRLLPRTTTLTTTTGVAPGDLVKLYREGLEAADTLLCLVPSEQLSRSILVAARAARQLVPEGDVTIMDTHTVGAGEALMVLAAARAAQDGQDKEQIIALVNELIPKVDVLFIAGTSEYLRRGGRLSGRQAFLGSLLNLKPVVRVEDGQIVPIARVRSRQGATARMLRVMEEQVGDGTEVHAAVTHVLARKEAEDLHAAITSRFRCCEVCILDELSPAIGSHLGPGTVGIGFYTEQALEEPAPASVSEVEQSARGQ